jgi:hypothetical protein
VDDLDEAGQDGGGLGLVGSGQQSLRSASPAAEADW